MAVSFEEARQIASERYSFPINYYEEYKDYFVFGYDDGTQFIGGPQMPVVIRKSDGAFQAYDSMFFGIDPNAEDAGKVISEGWL